MKSILLLTGSLIALSITLGLFSSLLASYQQQILNKILYQERHGLYDDDPHLEKLPGYFEEVSMVIQENHHFPLTDHEAWGNTLPGRRGFVRLGPKGRSFELSHFHQLHCVNSIRFAYILARDGLVKDPQILKAKIGHDSHCFKYLCQRIVCRADNSLVPVSGYNRSLSHAGFGVVHRCRNWAQVRHFVLQSRAKWDGVPYLLEV